MTWEYQIQRQRQTWKDWLMILFLCVCLWETIFYPTCLHWKFMRFVCVSFTHLGRVFIAFAIMHAMLIDAVFLHSAATKPLLLTFVTGCNWPTHVCIQEGIWSNGWLPDWFFWGAQFLLHLTLWYKIFINQPLTFKFQVDEAHYVFGQRQLLWCSFYLLREKFTCIFGCPFS